MSKKVPLTLLGVWNQLPIQIYVWQNDTAVAHLEKLTGVKLDTFCYLKDNLNYECFTQASTDALKSKFDALKPEEQRAYVQKITDDYYEHAAPLQAELDALASVDIAELDNEALAERIERLADLWSHVTMQIWYAVLLDIWYPRPEDKAGIKSVIAKARDHCGQLHERSDGIERAMYVEAAVRIGLSERDTYFLFQPELANALRNGSLEKQIITARLTAWVATSHSGIFRVYAGNKAQPMMESFAVPSIGAKKDGELKGTPASRGQVKGRVRVILLDKEFSDFQEGEILVSFQTMVHFLPVMKKSAAILTEFGGLTSHAAIVSRELSKPAIVGISGLVASLKTGDLIEVDADKGVVRILERAV